MPVASANSQSVAARVPWFGLALLACAVLALAGGFTQRHGLSLAAALLLLVAWLPRAWRQHSVAALGAWLALLALLLVPSAFGRAELALMALPVVFMGAIAWMFGRTLVRGREPLVSRFVRVIEGEARLALPGVRGYTRGVTVFWTLLLGVLSGLSLLIALLAVPGGWLATFGLVPRVRVPGSLLAWYPEAGCWVLLVAAFVGEYLFRRWYLRDIAHPGVRRFVVQIVRRWPMLLRDAGGPA